MATLPGLLPDRLGGLPAGAASLSGVSYDVVIGGIPFNSANTAEDPHVRETAPFKRDQTDQTLEAGEQSLGGWWYRSQSSWHGGAGLRYLDPAGADDPLARARFDTSKNMDPWTLGQLQRLPDTTLAIASGATGTKVAAGFKGTSDYVLFAAGTTLKALVIAAGGGTSTITITWTGTGAILGLACDGLNYYVADNVGVWTGPVDNSAVGTKLYDLAPATPTNVVLGWVKQRLMCCVNRSVYQLAATGAALPLPTALYTHPVVGWTWTCLSEEPQAILAGGYLGTVSGIVKFAMSTDGSVPTLTAGADAGSMPSGERVHSLRLLAGTWLGIGTSRGFRVGTFDSFSGRLQFGPLTVRTPNPVLAVADRGDFFYLGATSAIDGNTESGLIRVAIGQPTDQAGNFAYATDLICDTAQTGAVTGAVGTVSGRVAFSVDGYGLMLEGVGPGSSRPAWLRTARIRFTTTEPKLFKFGRLRGVFTAGECKVWASTPVSAEALVADVTATPTDPDQFRLPGGPLAWLALRFELLSSAVVTVTDWQVKALPAAKRERMIQLVLWCADRETDKRGNPIVRRGFGVARLTALEELEAAGDEVTLQQFLPELGTVNRQCVIDRVTFKQTRRPTQSEGQSGVLTVLLRTVS